VCEIQSIRNSKKNLFYALLSLDEFIKKNAVLEMMVVFEKKKLFCDIMWVFARWNCVNFEDFERFSAWVEHWGSSRWREKKYLGK